MISPKSGIQQRLHHAQEPIAKSWQSETAKRCWRWVKARASKETKTSGNNYMNQNSLVLLTSPHIEEITNRPDTEQILESLKFLFMKN